VSLEKLVGKVVECNKEHRFLQCFFLKSIEIEYTQTTHFFMHKVLCCVYDSD